MNLRGFNPGTGRIVGIGNKDQLGFGRNRFEHGIKVMPEIFCRCGDTGSTNRLGCQRIDGKSMLGINNLIPMTGKGPRQQFQHIIGAIAQRNLLRRQPQLFCQRHFQRVAIAIGVTCHFLR